MRIVAIFFAFSFLFSNHSFADTFYSRIGGDFDNPATWEGGGTTYPGPFDDVIIRHEVLFNLSSKHTINRLTIINESFSDASLSLSGTDTLVVLSNILVQAIDNNRDGFITLKDSVVLKVDGNFSLERVVGNLSNRSTYLELNNSSAVYVKGNLNFDYLGSGSGENQREIMINNTALLDVTGQSVFVNSAGEDFNLVLYQQGKAVFRDSVTLILTGTGKEAGITLHDQSRLDALDDISIYNSSTMSNDFAKIRVRESESHLQVEGNVHLISDKAKVQIRAEGTKGKITIAGDIVMDPSAENEAYVDIVENGSIYLGGEIIRPNNLGNLRMSNDGAFIFNGSSPQTIPERKPFGSGEDSLVFKKLVFENTSNQSFVLTEDLVIQDSLVLKNNNIISTESAMVVLQEGAAAKGDNTAYIEGPVLKLGTTAGLEMTVPIGTSEEYAPVTISEISNKSSEVKIQYFSEPPPFGVLSKEASIDNVRNDRYWTVEKNMAAGDLDVTLTWENSSEAGITNTNNTIVVGWDGTQWKNYGQEDAGFNAPGGFVTSAFSEPPPFGVLSFSIGTQVNIGSINSTSGAGFGIFLPVELNSFSAIAKVDKVYLNWKTESEIDNSLFVVERSKDGVRFETFYTVESRGDVDRPAIYYARDLLPYFGKNYYRLKMVDNDGSFEYSDIVTAKIDKHSSIKVFPNPVRDLFTIKLAEWEEETARIEIFNLNSILIYENEISMDSRSFQARAAEVNIILPGTYVVKITGSTFSRVVKFVKVE